jgi:peptidoglycan/xylan/chitin deacetylase (PgdA/CDA1 family)
LPLLELVTQVPPGQGEVALLFNADFFAGDIPSILDTLRSNDTRLTFFLTGGYLERFPDHVRAIDAAGHEIASHGYEHVDYRELSDEQIVGSLDRWQAAFAALTGKAGPVYWQPPYGYSNNRVRQAALRHGYTTIYWTLDSLDAVGEPKSRSFILERVLQGQAELDGAIVLMHVNGEGTVAALPEMLDRLEERGLRAVTISELLRR